MGQLGSPEVGFPAYGAIVVDGARAARPQHRKTVVLARDLGPAGGQVLDRMVGTVMAELELVGLQADRLAQQLVTEADPVHGSLPTSSRTVATM